jgi:hypothetical protein
MNALRRNGSLQSVSHTILAASRTGTAAHILDFTGAGNLALRASAEG